MASERVEVITRAERRRRWSSAEKVRLVLATREPGHAPHGVCAGHRGGWSARISYGFRRGVQRGAANDDRDRAAERLPAAGPRASRRQHVAQSDCRFERHPPGMLTPRSGSRIYLALRPVDMRKGFDGLAAQVQQVLQEDPFGGQLFLFRSRRGDRLKAVWWDGTGLCLFAKRVERGGFVSYGLCQPLRACAADRPSRGRPLSDAHDPHG